jgi:RNA polymerase sigma factor (sigma-70 family)
MFKRHYAPLLSYCRHMLGDRDEAEDALQQTFIRAHRAMREGTKPREVRPWLYAIARNCCLSAIAARKPTAPLYDGHPGLAGLAEEVHRREDLRELVVGIARLPEDQRSALLLAELEDLSHREIAGIVGCPVSKVKALIYQARSALIADRDALETPCRDVREQLAVARGGELRRGPLRRHLNLCTGCRDFQVAVGAQRQSLAAVLPVLPSAGLAAAILGHAAAHTIGATGGTAGGATATTGGAGISTSGATATASATGTGAGMGAGTSAGVGAGVSAGTSAGGGTGIGTLLGGGLVGKLAVGATIAAVATAGAVAVRHPARAARLPVQPGRRSGSLPWGDRPTTVRAGAPMLNAGFVQADDGSQRTEAIDTGAGANGVGGITVGAIGGSAVTVLSPGIAAAMTTPSVVAAPASADPARPPGGSEGSGANGRPDRLSRPGHHRSTSTSTSTSSARRAAQRKLRRERLRARRRLLARRRALARRQALKHRQLKRRRPSQRVAVRPSLPAVAPPRTAPARPAHRHKPRTTTSPTSEPSSSTSTTTTTTTAGTAPPKTSGRHRAHATGGRATGEAAMGTSGKTGVTGVTGVSGVSGASNASGTSGASSTTTGTVTSGRASGKATGASGHGTGTEACKAQSASGAGTTDQPRQGSVGHTHTCPVAQQEEM